MTRTTVTVKLELTRYDICLLGEIVASAATEAYVDERFHNSIMLHKIASRLWSHVGHPQKTTKHAALALAITQELLGGSNEDE